MRLTVKNRLRSYKKKHGRFLSAIAISCWLVGQHGCHAYLSTVHFGRTIRSLDAADTVVLDSGGTFVDLPSNEAWGGGQGEAKQSIGDAEVDFLSTDRSMPHSTEVVDGGKSNTAEGVSPDMHRQTTALPTSSGHSVNADASTQENAKGIVSAPQEAPVDEARKEPACGGAGGVSFARSAFPEGITSLVHDVDPGPRKDDVPQHNSNENSMRSTINNGECSSTTESFVSAESNVRVDVEPRGNEIEGKGEQAKRATSTPVPANECTLREDQAEEDKTMGRGGYAQGIGATAVREILRRRDARDAEVQAAGAFVAEMLSDQHRDTFLKLKAFAYTAADEGTREEDTPAGDCLSEEEATALETMAICGDRDGVLLAFLRHVNFNLKKAKESMRRCCTWRIETRADSLLQRGMPEKKVRKHRRYWHAGFHKHDREGRPVIYDRVGAADHDRLRSEPDALDVDDLVKIFCLNMEARRRFVLTRLSREAGRPVDQVTTVMDLSGLGLKHLTPETIRFLRRISEIFQDNYAGMTCSLLLVNAPWVFDRAWRIVEGFLSAETLAKIKVLGKGSNLLEGLAEYLPPENIPDFLGGPSQTSLGPDDPLWVEIDAARRAMAEGRDPFLNQGEVRDLCARLEKERSGSAASRGGESSKGRRPVGEEDVLQTNEHEFGVYTLVVQELGGREHHPKGRKAKVTVGGRLHGGDVAAEDQTGSGQDVRREESKTVRLGPVEDGRGDPPKEPREVRATAKRDRRREKDSEVRREAEMPEMSGSRTRLEGGAVEEEGCPRRLVEVGTAAAGNLARKLFPVARFAAAKALRVTSDAGRLALAVIWAILVLLRDALFEEVEEDD